MSDHGGTRPAAPAGIEAWRERSARDRRAAFADARAALDADAWNCVRQRFASAADEPPPRTGADARTMAPHGALDGVPCLVKANLAVEGEALDCASAILEGHRSPFSATVVERLRAAGAWVLGSTNMDEFGMGSSSEFSVQGAVVHPLASDRVAGGSSGGSAVAVAAGLVPFALGSDTGGSVRQPAAFCGVVGLQPTWGRVSRHGLVAFASSLDTIGVLAHDVADAGRVLVTIAGPDGRDATCRADVDPVELPAVGALSRGVALAGTRVGVIEVASQARALDVEIEPAVREAYERSVHELRAAGATIVPVALPSFATALAAYTVISSAEASSNLARYDGSLYGRRVEDAAAACDLDTMVRRTRTLGFGLEVQQRILLGTWALSRGWGDRLYRRALGVREQWRHAVRERFDAVDVLLAPTTPTVAFARGARIDDPVAMRAADLFTVASSLCGLPAIALPFGHDASGLPTSVQIIGRAFDESTVLRVAAALEARR